MMMIVLLGVGLYFNCELQWSVAGTGGRLWTALSSTTMESESGRSLGGRGSPRRGGGPPPPRSPTSSSRIAFRREADRSYFHSSPFRLLPHSHTHPTQNFFQENKSTKYVIQKRRRRRVERDKYTVQTIRDRLAGLLLAFAILFQYTSNFNNVSYTQKFIDIQYLCLLFVNL